MVKGDVSRAVIDDIPTLEDIALERVEAAYRAGIAEAVRDIATGQPRLRYDARGAWGEDLERTLRTRFGVELVVLSCFTSDALASFDAGYNSTIEAHIDKLYGPGSIQAVRDEIKHRRKVAYNAWAASKEEADGDCT